LLRSTVTEGWARRWREVNDSFGVFMPGYPVTTRDEDLTVHLELDRAVAARKVRALAAQTTQTAGLIAAMGQDSFTAWVSEEAFAERHPAGYAAQPL
jgi:hypothetical protein